MGILDKILKKPKSGSVMGLNTETDVVVKNKDGKIKATRKIKNGKEVARKDF